MAFYPTSYGNKKSNRLILFRLVFETDEMFGRNFKTTNCFYEFIMLNVDERIIPNSGTCLFRLKLWNLPLNKTGSEHIVESDDNIV